MQKMMNEIDPISRLETRLGERVRYCTSIGSGEEMP